jgi:hypothetical protein
LKAAEKEALDVLQEKARCAKQKIPKKLPATFVIPDKIKRLVQLLGDIDAGSDHNLDAHPSKQATSTSSKAEDAVAGTTSPESVPATAQVALTGVTTANDAVTGAGPASAPATASSATTSLKDAVAGTTSPESVPVTAQVALTGVTTANDAVTGAGPASAPATASSATTSLTQAQATPIPPNETCAGGSTASAAAGPANAVAPSPVAAATIGAALESSESGPPATLLGPSGNKAQGAKAENVPGKQLYEDSDDEDLDYDDDGESCVNEDHHDE